LKSHRILTDASILLANTNNANTFLGNFYFARCFICIPNVMGMAARASFSRIRTSANMHSILIDLQCGLIADCGEPLPGGSISLALIATPAIGGPITGLSTRAFIHTVAVLRLGFAAPAGLRRCHASLIFLRLPRISGVRVIATCSLSVATRSDPAPVGGALRECA